MEEDDFTLEPPHSLKYKLKSLLCFSCCFSHRRVKPRIVRCSSLGTHNNSRSTEFSHLKEKCSNFISRLSHHQRYHPFNSLSLHTSASFQSTPSQYIMQRCFPLFLLGLFFSQPNLSATGQRVWA